MKFFAVDTLRHRMLRLNAWMLCCFAAAAAGWKVSRSGVLPSWLYNVEAKTAIEAALFRSMSLPGGAVLFPRPPSETRPAPRSELIGKQPKNPAASFYSLRCHGRRAATGF